MDDRVDELANRFRQSLEELINAAKADEQYERKKPTLKGYLKHLEKHLLLRSEASFPSREDRRYQELMAKKAAKTISPLEAEELRELRRVFNAVLADKPIAIAKLAVCQKLLLREFPIDEDWE